MRAHIVCYEQPPSWILGKIASRLCQALTELGADASMSGAPDPEADINHHIYYILYAGAKSKLDTVLVTHIDSLDKLHMLLAQLKVADGAVIFSRETRSLLIEAGAPEHALAAINPPQDEIIKPRKLTVGLLTNVYARRRKREDLIIDLARSADLSAFRFEIMGTGWDEVTGIFDQCGVEYVLHPDFDHDLYIALVRGLDYLLYTGMDEGSMAFLDALAADVKTIVTPQGFHLDTQIPIDYPFETVAELIAIFKRIAAERRVRPNAVAGWTWAHYARAHLDFWQALNDRGS